MKIAVVGGGVFGCTVAWKLAEKGRSVDLFETKRCLLSCASEVNHFRLHRGYHYPRSLETIRDCLKGEVSFRKEYGPSIIAANGNHYYAIASAGSLLDEDQCLKAWSKSGLEFQKAELSILSNQSCKGVFRVREDSIDPFVLRLEVETKLKRHMVNLKTATLFRPSDIGKYDAVVVATYELSNELLDSEFRQPYQFEIVESPLFLLPKAYSDLSVVIQDGPFMCIDPIGRTGLTVMGNVVHQIHHRSTGLIPEVPEPFRVLLNAGLIEKPPLSKVGSFLDVAETFFPDIRAVAEYRGSRFTVRTVLPFRDHDDARPSVVRRAGPRVIAVFGGKIPTCVDAAESVSRMLDEWR